MSAAAPASPAPVANGNGDRHSNGRFAPGNRAGTGNPFARQVASLRQALLDSVTEADLAEVAQALLARAKQGDVAAAKLLLSYLIGKPEPAPDPDKLDHREWQHYQEESELHKQLPKVVAGSDLGLSLELARTMRPIMASVAGGKVQHVLNLPDKELQAINDNPRRLDDVLLDLRDKRRKEARAQARAKKAAPPPSANGSNGEPAPQGPPPPVAELTELLRQRTTPPTSNGNGQPTP
jgi:hypothetical protein